MADARVTCVTKASRMGSHESITHIGGTDWKWTVPQVIESIRMGTSTFYTFVGGRRADIGIVKGQNGEYLRTYADNTWNDNLLALPQCS